MNKTEKILRNWEDSKGPAEAEQWKAVKALEEHGFDKAAFLKKANKGTEEEKKEVMKYCYDIIHDTISKYCDLRPEYYPIVTLWVMGTYMHDKFNSYPYLYFNAMKGSGKTRILRLISSLSRNGKLVGSPSEAVLFRTAADSTFCIDEFESIGSKDKASLRELLNSAYKKGLFIERLKKISTKGVESYVPEQFNVYCPITIANIWGMDEVLGDRCISLVLERSNDPIKTRLVENEGFLGEFRSILNIISVVSVVSLLKKTYNKWNDYVTLHYKTTLTTHTTHTTKTTLTTQDIALFEKIDSKGITGRNFELFFPLLILASMVDDLLLEDILETASKLVKEKNDEDINESKDVMLFEFLSMQMNTNKDWIMLSVITNNFKEFVDSNDDWINTKWMGRALKRLNLVLEKVRQSGGRKVRIDIAKAKKQINMFRVPKEEVVK